MISVNTMRARDRGNQMGGYFSTRWGSEHIRQDTGSLLFLDATKLRKMGALEPGVIAWHEWTNGRGDIIGGIQTYAHATGDTLTLSYSIRENGNDWQPIRERIDLEGTPCNYGGERLWLTCPGCDTRRRVLYCNAGRFRCRQCHDLAYTSTREDTHDRSIRRTKRLQKRLGASSVDLFHIPEKPRGTHWDTYEHAVAQLISEHDIQLASLRAFIDKRESLIARLNESVAKNQT